MLFIYYSEFETGRNKFLSKSNKRMFMKWVRCVLDLIRLYKKVVTNNPYPVLILKNCIHTQIRWPGVNPLYCCKYIMTFLGIRCVTTGYRNRFQSYRRKHRLPAMFINDVLPILAHGSRMYFISSDVGEDTTACYSDSVKLSYFIKTNFITLLLHTFCWKSTDVISKF